MTCTTLEDGGTPIRAERRPLRLLKPANLPISHRTSPSDVRQHVRLGQPNSTSTSLRCGLIQCRKPKCDLTSHRQFAAARRAWLRTSASASSEWVANIWHPQPSSGVLDTTVWRIERQIADGLPQLPLHSEGSSTFRELTHYYFVHQIDRLIQLFSPQLDSRTYKSTMMNHALSNDIFCVCIMANAKTDMLMRAHVRTPDRASRLVYATTSQTLRRKLDTFKTTDLDWLLVLVVALVGFDLAFDRVENLQGHHRAVKQLIDLKGGVHAVGHTLPYVVSTDRFLAVFTGQYPYLRKTPLWETPFAAPLSPNPYGRIFQHRVTAHTIDRPVLDFCVDQCRLLHLMESAQVSLIPRTAPAADLSALPHFLYLRDRLICEGTCLHADYHENQQRQRSSSTSDNDIQAATSDPCLSKSRCVLLTVLIIEYVVAHANYYTVKALFLADQLKSVLERQPKAEWDDHRDLLTWILFVAAALPNRWQHHGWAVHKLQQQLVKQYDGTWPCSTWQDNLRTLLNDHIWAKSLEVVFHQVCHEISLSQPSKE